MRKVLSFLCAIVLLVAVSCTKTTNESTVCPGCNQTECVCEQPDSTVNVDETVDVPTDTVEISE